MRWAVAVAGEHEGLLLDPVYGARVLAALRDGLRHGELAPTTTVVLLHTGGTSILHAAPYRKDLRATAAGPTVGAAHGRQPGRDRSLS